VFYKKEAPARQARQGKAGSGTLSYFPAQK